MKAAEPSTFPVKEPSLLTVTASERSAEYTAFLKYVAQYSGTISYEQLVILYPSICQAALEWLLREKKSVDFGFVMLHPMPHRANRKQILLAMFPGLGPTILGKSKAVKESIMQGTGFITKLLSGELLAICRDRYVVWGIETELKRSWWRAMLRLEAYKHSQLGSVDYAAHTARAIVKLQPKLVRSYVASLRQVSYPCARIQHSRVYRRGYIVPMVPKGKVRPVSAADIPVDFVVARDPAAVTTPKVSEVAQQNVGLPEVPDIRSGGQDLRVTLSEPTAGE